MSLRNFGIRILSTLIAAVYSMTVGWAQPSSYMDERPTKRLAFIVGNEIYGKHERLPSAKVDAERMEGVLKALGFDVSRVSNIGNRAEFWDVNFSPFAKKIKENDLVVFFFSGHGMAYKGENLLLLTEAPELIPEEELLDIAVPVSSVEDYIRQRKAGLSLMFLDSCRVVSGSVKSAENQIEGIAKGPTQAMPRTSNVVISFASSFGYTSLGRSDADKMSYFTEALVEFLPQQDLIFDQVKRKTRLKVIYNTSNIQVPWFSESDSSQLFLKPSKETSDDEKNIWESRLRTNDQEQIWNFAQEYSISRFVAAAKRWLEDYKLRKLGLTKVAPTAVDAAWRSNPLEPVSTLRIDGPFAFRKIGRVADGYPENPAVTIEGDARRGDAVSVARAGAEILARQQLVFTTSTLAARTEPSESAPLAGTVGLGTPIDIAGVVDNPSGEPWLQIRSGTGAAFLPASRISLGRTPLGFSLREIEVSPAAGGHPSRMDDGMIRSAVAELKRAGRSINRVSVSAPPTTTEKDLRLASGRIAYAILLLERAGVDRHLITAVNGGKDHSGDNLRVRFYGN